ncbi:MAG TPA: S41 family peptidase, partial [Flavobacteriales bacterium]|nr:S41 family peptidase [Flavobacteriales bacterium]
MRTANFHILFAACLLNTDTTAQPCDCPATFSWMVSTFEQNDAGFQLVVDRKGESAYAEHTATYRAKAAQGTDLMACTELLNEWLQWFRRGHIGIGPTEQGQAAMQPTAGSAAQPTALPATRSVKITEADLVKRLQKVGATRHAMEGVWTMDAYRVGIVRQPKDPSRLDAVILASKNKNWQPGMVKAEVQLQADGRCTGTFYMGDHSRRDVAATMLGTSGGLLVMNGIWQRQYPPAELTVMEQLHLRMVDAEAPFLLPLSDRTLYLRIPSFAFEQKVLIDSVLTANDALIRRTDNLIIDIRNGTGGSDASYSGLIPYLYTQPIRSVSVKLRA